MNLSCSADGFPVPDIRWYFQSTPFTTESVKSTNVTYTESIIVINSLMLSDGGIYECIIDNDAMMVSNNHSTTVAVIDGMCACSSFIMQGIMMDYNSICDLILEN